MFAGVTSRWMIPWPWAYSRARPMWTPTRKAYFQSSIPATPIRRITSVRLSPSTSSIAAQQYGPLLPAA